MTERNDDLPDEELLDDEERLEDDVATSRRPPTVRFPVDVEDRSGRRLRPGSVVLIVAGARAGTIGEVVGWGGRRGLEVVFDADPPEMVTAMPGDVEVVAHVLRESATSGFVVVEESEHRPAVILPVGGQDIQRRPDAGLGPFPDPGEFETARGSQRKVRARAWGEACLEAIAGFSEVEQARTVADHLDAPMLRRALEEAALPIEVRRLVCVASDQDHPQRDDTLAFARLLRLWTLGSGGELGRRVEEIDEPIVLSAAPHLVSAVIQQVTPEIPRTLDDCDVAVVVQAGGTPSMTFGTLLAYTSGNEIPVRHLQVPRGQPVLEIDFPSIVERARTQR